MKKRELLIKSREAMLAAVQIYNNPQITFKSENYITLSVIAWTYLLHCYYANKSIEYRYWHMAGKKKVYDRTKYGAFKHWELQRCLDEKKSPIDKETTENLKFLIGLRHEIEHQMTQNIDHTVSAKIQACSINYNYYIKELFGVEYGVDGQLGLAIQFSPIQPSQKEALQNNIKVASNVSSFICSFEESLTDQDVTSPRYAYRVLFTRLNAKRKGQADQVIEFVSDGTEGAENLNKTYMLIKETEKKKYLSKEIVELMHSKGYTWFTTGTMTGLWKNELGSRDQFGLYITKTQWMWYENWIPVVEEYCKKESASTPMLSPEEKPLYANNLVELIKQRGYTKFSIYWLESLWKYEMEIDRNNTIYGYFDRNKRFVWSKDFIPIVEDYCKKKWS
jgi:hypothetical protein